MALYTIDATTGKWVPAQACIGVAEDQTCSAIPCASALNLNKSMTVQGGTGTAAPVGGLGTAGGIGGTAVAEGKAPNAVDCHIHAFFMDVGCWQGGADGKPKTTYGVICGHDALLCDWLGYKYSPLDREQAYYDACYSPPNDVTNVAPALREFLAACKGYRVPNLPQDLPQNLLPALSRRGSVLNWARSEDEPFTKNNDLLVVVPDTHIHLFKEHPVDRFVYRLTADAKKTDGTPRSLITSLDPEMGAFLNLAKHGTTTGNVSIIQLGDWFDVWEDEMLLRWTYKILLDHVEQSFYKTMPRWPNENKQGADPKGAFSRYFGTDDDALKQMIVTGKVLVPPPPKPKDDGSFVDFPQHILDCINGQWKGLSWEKCKASAVDFTSTEDICQAVKMNYPGAFPANTFDALLHGNHDNFLANGYWKRVDWAQHSFDIFGKLKAPTKGWHLADRKKYNYQAPNNYKYSRSGHPTVWVEHGHYYDFHNNDEHWSEDGRGFDTVFRGPLGPWTKALAPIAVGVIATFAGGPVVGLAAAEAVAEGISISDFIITKTKYSRGFTDSVLTGADIWAFIFHYEMRLPEFRLADVVIGQHFHNAYVPDRGPDKITGYPAVSEPKTQPAPKLIIMGHTHNPGTLEYPAGTPLPSLTVKNENLFCAYMRSDYFMADDDLSSNEAQFELTVETAAFQGKPSAG